MPPPPPQSNAPIDPVAAPADPELVRKIQAVATHITVNPTLMVQLMSKHGDDQSLAFIHPSGEHHSYFQYALNCKRMNASCDPSSLTTRISLPIPPPFPYDSITTGSSVLEHAIRATNYLLPVMEQIVVIDKDLLTAENEPQRIVSTKLAFDSQAIQKVRDQYCVEKNRNALCGVFLAMLRRLAINLGTFPISTESDCVYDGIYNAAFIVDGVLHRNTFTRAVVILGVIVSIALGKDAIDVDSSPLWLDGHIPWAMRFVTLIGDALRRRALGIDNRRGNSSHGDLDIWDPLSAWSKALWHNSPLRDCNLGFEQWRTAARPPCHYDNTFQVIGHVTIYSKPRDEAFRSAMSRQNPYLQPFPRQMVSSTSFGKLTPITQTCDQTILSTDALPVGVMSSILQQASHKTKLMHKSFSPYHPLNVMPTGIPPMHPYPPTSVVTLAKECLHLMKSEMSPKLRKVRRVEQSDDDMDDAPELSDIITGSIDTQTNAFVQPVVLDHPQMGSGFSREQSATGGYQRTGFAASPGGGAPLGPKKQGLGMVNTESASNKGDSNDLFETFRQRRSGTYHKAIVDYRTGSGLAGLRCYVCQQTGHFAKDCKFGLN